MVNDPTSITATVPPGTAAGAVSVIVTTLPGSNVANTLYTYVALPTITALSPSTGRVAGGTTVTITGTGFTGTTAVTFAGLNATSFTVNSDTSITVVTPPVLQPLSAQVAVIAPGGTATSTFTYSATATNARPGVAAERRLANTGGQ